MTKSIVIALAMALSSASAFAVDGQVLINMSTVNAAGGFPYKITQLGSYKLSGNLFLPDANTTGIQILSNAVTLDLNGFAIIGPGTPGSGEGVQIGTDLQAFFNITIRNGTIQGAGNHGVFILGGDSVIVEDMNIGGNRGNGIFNAEFVFLAKNIIVRHSTIAGNGAGGVGLNGGCIVADNTVSVNSSYGISVVLCNVARNTIIGNGSVGLAVGTGGGYQGNIISGNAGGAVLGNGGINLGGNACNGSLCP